MNASRNLLCLTLLLGVLNQSSFAGGAPAPTLFSPASSATNVDPDPTLTWRWVDDLMVNGSFETGFSPGWYTGGQNPTIWQIYTSPTNVPGMGYKLATTYMPNAPTSNGSLIQDLYIPADATSAALQWKEQIWNLGPISPMIGRLRVWLVQSGVAVALLEDATGKESQFLSHNWVSRGTNLLAFAGQSFQLVIRADGYSPLAANSWYANIDGFTFSCEHLSSPPIFQVYLGKSATLRSTNLVGETTSLSFAAPPLDSLTTYYWRVGAVRDGVTNYSSTFSFRTGVRVLPRMTVTGITPTGVRLSFSTKTGRNYTIEQRDTLGPFSAWFEVLPAVPGTGSTMEVEVPLPWADTAFWRLKVTP